jgi:hypothetical protein
MKRKHEEHTGERADSPVRQPVRLECFVNTALHECKIVCMPFLDEDNDNYEEQYDAQNREWKARHAGWAYDQNDPEGTEEFLSQLCSALGERSIGDTLHFSSSGCRTSWEAGDSKDASNYLHIFKKCLIQNNPAEDRGDIEDIEDGKQHGMRKDKKDKKDKPFFSYDAIVVLSTLPIEDAWQEVMKQSRHITYMGVSKFQCGFIIVFCLELLHSTDWRQ